MGHGQPARLPARYSFEDWKAYVEELRAYWTTKGMSWRTEPEIGEDRQSFLTKRRAVQRNARQSVYPFVDQTGSIKLSRGDVEWLLATHGSGGMQGPIDWQDVRQRRREGVDFGGADLRGADLRGLPLARCMFSGVGTARVFNWSVEESVNPGSARLEGAILTGAHLEGCYLSGVHLESADLTEAILDSAILDGAHLEGARLSGASLQHAHLLQTNLAGANLHGAHLEGASLSGPQYDLGRAIAELRAAFTSQGEMATPTEGDLEREVALFPTFSVDLAGKRVDDATLSRVRESVKDFPTILPPADLTSTHMDPTTSLADISFGSASGGFASLAGVDWGGVDLSVVEWAHLKMPGEEWQARQSRTLDGRAKGKARRRVEYENATRTNRQLAIAMRQCGLVEDADRFAYRAQRCQRVVLLRQRRLLRYFGSLILNITSGY